MNKTTKKRINKRKPKTKYRRKYKKQIGGKIAKAELNSFEKVISEIRSITKDLPNELCGSIKVDGDKYNPIFTVFQHQSQASSGDRANCNYDDYLDPILWHNHPSTSKFYPSVEDILKVIKSRRDPEVNIRVSLIFTNFGYWQLESINRVTNFDEYKHNIQRILDQLYHNTGKGRIFIPDPVTNCIVSLNMLLNGILNVSFNYYP